MKALYSFPFVNKNELAQCLESLKKYRAINLVKKSPIELIPTLPLLHSNTLSINMSPKKELIPKSLSGTHNNLDKNIKINEAKDKNDIIKEIDQLNFPISNFVPAQYSRKKNSEIEAYGVITHEGLVRKYNEDRVAIILNVMKPYNRRVYNWPKICFFGLYDGHGGNQCVDYLRDHFHYTVNECIT